MKKVIKKAAIVFMAIAFMGVIGTSSVSAAGLTDSQISAIMTLLQAFGASQDVVNNVQISLSGGTPTITPQPAAFCYTFNKDLTIGSVGTDVLKLVRALDMENVIDTEFSSDFGRAESLANYDAFDETLAGYVVKFQAKYGIRQTGYMGPLTRAKLNKLYGCQTTTVLPTPSPTTSVTLPTTSSTNSITLPYISYVQSPAEDKNVIHAGERANIYGNNLSGVTAIYVNSQIPSMDKTVTSDSSLQFYIPANLTSGTAVIYVETVDGKRSNSIIVKVIGTVSQTSTTQPAITVLSPNGGEIWKIGEKYEISWSATGIEKVIINMSNTDTGYGTTLSSDARLGKVSFVPPSYLPSGQYKVSISDSSREQYKDYSDSYFTITAPTATTQPLSITVLTPTNSATGAHSFKTGDNLNIQWSSVGVRGVKKIALIPTDSSKPVVYALNQTNLDFPLTVDSYSWTIPATVQSGTYKVKVIIGTDVVSDESDGTISISSAVDQQPPYISSVTPSLRVGDKIGIYGQRLYFCNGFSTFIDGKIVDPQIIDGSKDYTTLFFILPNLTVGQHYLYVKNDLTGESNRVYFNVVSVSAQPSITSVEPASIAVGTDARIVVYGSGFRSGNAITNVVLVKTDGSISASYTPVAVSNDGTNLAFIVQEQSASKQLTSGTYRLDVVQTWPSYQRSNVATFTITAPVVASVAPVITSISPTKGALGTPLAITGSNFSTTNTNYVDFTANSTLVKSVAATTAVGGVVLVVPNILPGAYSVTVRSSDKGVSSNSINFEVPAFTTSMDDGNQTASVNDAVNAVLLRYGLGQYAR